MLVKMRTTAACPDYILDAGKTYNLSKSLGDSFVKAGYADQVDPSTKPKVSRVEEPDPGQVEEPDDTFEPDEDDE